MPPACPPTRSKCQEMNAARSAPSRWKHVAPTRKQAAVRRTGRWARPPTPGHQRLSAISPSRDNLLGDTVCESVDGAELERRSALFSLGRTVSIVGHVLTASQVKQHLCGGNRSL